MIDYRIYGLDSFTVQIAFKGSSHFLNHIDPSFYEISKISLEDGTASIEFEPTDNLPEQLNLPINYGIEVAPHEEFSLVLKDSSEVTSAYVFLNCKKNQDGKSFFHYDILMKDDFGEKDKFVHMGDTIEGLEKIGYKKTLSEDSGEGSKTVINLSKLIA